MAGYEIFLDAEAEAAVRQLMEMLEVYTHQDVLSLCLGFVYQLMLLAQKNAQVREFVGAIGERFKAEYGDNTRAN